MIKVTHHEAVRFLQRVMNKSKYSQKDLYLAYRFLENELQDIVTRGYKDYFRLPSFNNYRAVVVENQLVTILPKEWYVR